MGLIIYPNLFNEKEDEIIAGLIKEQKLMANTIQELMGICTELVDRVKTLEEEIKFLTPVKYGDVEAVKKYGILLEEQ